MCRTNFKQLYTHEYSIVYIHVYLPERQQQQVKKHQTHNKNKQTKKRKNYAQIGRASEQCYHIYTPTNSKNIC